MYKSHIKSICRVYAIKMVLFWWTCRFDLDMHWNKSDFSVMSLLFKLNACIRFSIEKMIQFRNQEHIIFLNKKMWSKVSAIDVITSLRAHFLGAKNTNEKCTNQKWYVSAKLVNDAIFFSFSFQMISDTKFKFFLFSFLFSFIQFAMHVHTWYKKTTRVLVWVMESVNKVESWCKKTHSHRTNDTVMLSNIQLLTNDSPTNQPSAMCNLICNHFDDSNMKFQCMHRKLIKSLPTFALHSLHNFYIFSPVFCGCFSSSLVQSQTRLQVVAFFCHWVFSVGTFSFHLASYATRLLRYRVE